MALSLATRVDRLEDAITPDDPIFVRVILRGEHDGPEPEPLPGEQRITVRWHPPAAEVEHGNPDQTS
jgi:hypothetical protein